MDISTATFSFKYWRWKKTRNPAGFQFKWGNKTWRWKKKFRKMLSEREVKMSSGDRTNKLCHVCETLHRFLRLSDECSSITCMTCNQSRGKSKRRLCEQPTIAASDEELALSMQFFSVQSQSIWDIVDGESQPESSWCHFV